MVSPEFRNIFFKSRTCQLTNDCLASFEVTDTNGSSEGTTIGVRLTYGPDEQTVDLKNFVSSEAHIMVHFFPSHGKGFMASIIGSNKVGIPDESFSDKKDIWSLLHEIGHLIQNKGLTERDISKLYFEESIYDKHLNGNLTLDESKILINFEERAWREAIKLAQALATKTGINLFEMFQSSEDFVQCIRKAFGSYKNISLKLGSMVLYKTLKEERFDQFARDTYDKVIKKE